MSSEQTSATKNLFVGVNEPEDLDNLSDLEKKHHPVIEAPDDVDSGECFEVTVEVGKLLEHPNEHAHFIQFMDLYADHTFLARVDFTSVKSSPKVTFWVTLEEPAEELRVYDHCNLHGTWVGRKPIKVK
ncbi:MAG TPA: desulfoferrodoxin family protein [Phycisphaerae bacterium]|nr:desulfoferrodoxin family protein [Phycisphaerae bacterium]